MRIGLWLLPACTLAIPLSAAGWIAPDPLSAVLALLLGLPWSHLLFRLVETQSLAVNFGLLAVSLAINAVILRLLGRALSQSRRRLKG